MCHPMIAIAPTAATPSATGVPHSTADRIAKIAIAAGAASPRSKIAFTMRRHAQYQRDTSFRNAESVRAAATRPDHLLGAVRLVACGGDHDDRQVARPCVTTQTPRECEPRLPRQHPVEQNEVRKRVADLLLSALRVGNRMHREACIFEVHAQQFTNRRLVL